MSGPARIKSTNPADSESRPVLVPAGNKARTIETRKSVLKPQKKVEKPQAIDEAKARKATSSPAPSPSPSPSPRQCINVPSFLKQQDHKLLKSNSSLSASCSSEASSDSSHSGSSSTGRISRRSVPPILRKQRPSNTKKIVTDTNIVSAAASLVKKRCAWVTSNADLCYADFHDKEWGTPVHDDKKLFELLILSTALAELTWPAILNKRHMFREVFLDYDPIAVSKLNEKKIATPGSPSSSLLSELKLRAIIENARQMCKIIDEFGSFDKYIWGFVNHKPIVSQFRHPHQVPIKTSKADAISKDLVRRGFRGVGPTVIHSFMQVAGITIDHLISCFRFQECVAAADARYIKKAPKAKVEEKQPEATSDLELASVNYLGLSKE
ncbi:uncharacterized protein LOC132285364 [Cornus florida]|uniref:uncharacterized protein LOC132285364 n=1 Tax=Cornus florida TaxID=4283 RepID=UPI00289889E0|nr:uncharacterized protein LOC132285364 [Cornus florida]